jgi:hypothetical protein
LCNVDLLFRTCPITPNIINCESIVGKRGSKETNFINQDSNEKLQQNFRKKDGTPEKASCMGNILMGLEAGNQDTIVIHPSFSEGVDSEN